MADAGGVEGVGPVAVLFEGGADDEGVGVGEVVTDVAGGDAGADEDGERGMLVDGLEFGEAGGLSGGGAGEDDAVGEEEFGGVGGLDDVEVGGEGVGGVLFLDVGEDSDVVGADLAAVAEEVAGAGVDVAFVGEVPEDEAFGADELGARGVGGGEGLAVGAGEDLDAEGEGGVGAADFGGDDGHGGGDGGAGAAEVGDVVHVFDHEGVDAEIGVGLRFVEGVLDDGVHGVGVERGAGEGAHMDHADDGSGAVAEDAGEGGCFHGISVVKYTVESEGKSCYLQVADCPTSFATYVLRLGWICRVDVSGWGVCGVFVLLEKE